MSIESEFASAVAALAVAEGESNLAAFAAAVELNEIQLDSAPHVLQGRLGIPSFRLRAYRDTLMSAPTPQALVLALRVASELTARARAFESTVEVAWTYPSMARPGLRTTAGVAREIIEASKTSLLIVGYSVSVDESLSGLAAQTIAAMARAAQRGVVVTAVLQRGNTRATLLKGWLRGVPTPTFFTWPQTTGGKASIHAKLLIADGSDGLVTSANLTYQGLQKNLEMGIRLKGAAVAEIHQRITELIGNGELVAWE